MSLIHSSTLHIASHFPTSITKSLYHVTKLKNLESILKNGLKTSYYGTIHGEMAIHPESPSVYLSRKSTSDNLNTRLFEDNPQLIVIEVNPSFISLDSIYPDDALFVGFGDENVFVDAEDIACDLQCDESLAESLLEIFDNSLDHELPETMKHLWPWYLSSHGEISVTHDIPPEAILGYKML